MIGERKEAWFRIIVLIVSGIILNIWRALATILGIVNWFIVIISGNRNKEMAEFCEYWNTQLYKFIRYLTFVSNERPWPFEGKLDRMSKFK